MTAELEKASEERRIIEERHFKHSPFKNADQLNNFLLVFGVIATLLCLAFVIQCFREIVKGDEAPVQASPPPQSQVC